MATETLTRDDLCRWRELLSAPTRAGCAAIAALLGICALVIPFSGEEAVAWLFLFGCVPVYYFIARSARALLIPILPAALLFLLSGTAMLPAVFGAILLGGAACAMLLLHAEAKRTFWLIPTVAVAAYLLAFLGTGDPLRGLLCLLPLPIGMTAALCVRRCVPQTESTAYLAGTLALTLAVAWVVTLAATGALFASPLTALAEELRAAIVTLMTELRDLYAAEGIELGMTDVSIENVAATVVNLLPALFLVLCSVTAHVLWRTLLFALLSFGTLPRIPARLGAFTMSAVSAALFVLSYVISLFANAENVTVAGTVLENLALVLEPGLALIGFAVLFGRNGSRSCLSLLLALGLIFVLFSNPGIGLTLAAFYGALHILLARFFPAADDNQGGQ